MKPEIVKIGTDNKAYIFYSSNKKYAPNRYVSTRTIQALSKDLKN